MRALVIIFACLAILKVWTQDTLYRDAVSSALVSAYRPHAEKLCTREAARVSGVKTTQWSMPDGEAITVGSKVASVMIWDYDNPMWAVRYRHPHMVMQASGARPLTCSYDLAVGIAFIQAL